MNVWGRGGGEHGAQGCGFHSHFHFGPAIVFPSETLQWGCTQQGPKWQMLNSVGFLACGPSKAAFQTMI